jgi:UDP-2-acetamido-2-deoxy-ribo-hexuluronate aminotransferase
VATAEVIGLLRLTPILVDVNPNTFDMAASDIERQLLQKQKRSSQFNYMDNLAIWNR